MQKVNQKKKDWFLTPDVFHRLLEWLDGGVDSGGQKYLEMRQRLVAYFDRKNCLTPEELADETLNRVSRRLEEEGTIESESPAKYCYIVARFVFMESLRAPEKKGVPIDDVLSRSNVNAFVQHARDDEREIKEVMLDCLEQCMGGLESVNRDIIIRYYFGEERVKIENRRGLAASLDITMNALAIRACRIRDKLEDCVRKCAAAV
jgi:DNA-directed RNA polymerase specialized sigma24 family protein